MEINKYNLFINKNFDSYQFTDHRYSNFYNVNNSNLVINYIFFTLQSKPTDTTTYSIININNTINCYIYPVDAKSIAFQVGDIFKTIDDGAIFILTNNISENLFTFKLVYCENNTNYRLYNNTPTLFINEKLEYYWYNNNMTNKLLLEQRDNYTQQLNVNDDFLAYAVKNLSIDSDTTTDMTVSFNFKDFDVTDELVVNIIDKFFINIQLYDYSDFKYIYKKDIISNLSKQTLHVNSRKIVGVLKTSLTKIIPHYTTKLYKNNIYKFVSNTINDYTSYKKSYDGNKILLLIQLSLTDKSNVYDSNDNIESNMFYIII